MEKYKVESGEIYGMSCYEPAFIERQIDISRNNLGLETIDLVYLHNPENLKQYIGYKALLGKIEVGLK